MLSCYGCTDRTDMLFGPNTQCVYCKRWLCYFCNKRHKCAERTAYLAKHRLEEWHDDWPYSNDRLRNNDDPYYGEDVL